MKRVLIISGVVLLFLFIGAVVGVYIWIDQDVKKNIKIAQSQYPGKAEDALIAYLLDTTHSPYDRSSVAIWTLGHIQSKKALPVLKKLYKNDPKGLTCKGRHVSSLCQYEIYKAIWAIDHYRWPLHARLNR